MDRLVIDYLKNRGMSNMNEQDFMDKFKQMMHNYKKDSMYRGYSRRDGFEDYDNTNEFMNMFNSSERPFDGYNDFNKEDYNMHNIMRYMREAMSQDNPITEHEAKYIISEMYHMENGRKHSGEKYDMHKAKEVCTKYRGILPSNTSHVDMYIAINTQYHNYAELFKNWFGDNIDQKIIESAIIFWFKDVNCKSKNKVAKYLKD